MQKNSRKRSVLEAVAAILVIAAGAYAYWTSTGSGRGSSGAGKTSAVTVNQTTTLSAMYPGDSAQTISGNFDNPNSGPVYVGTVSASIASYLMSVEGPLPGLGSVFYDVTSTDRAGNTSAAVTAS